MDMKRKWNTLTEENRPLSIREGCISSSKKLLMLAPHPDDFDAIGVTLRFLSSCGNPLQVIVACTGSGVDDSYRPGLSIAGKAQLRKREQRNSAHFFGLPSDCLTFLHLENDDDDQPLDDKKNLDKLGSLILQKGPDIIFLPHGNDTNSGHKAIYSLVHQYALSSNLPIALLLIRDPKTVSMRTDLYLPFDESDAEWKAELLRFHASQQQRNLSTRGHGFDERILEHNRQIASELSLEHHYAEAFEVEIHNMT